MLLLSNRKGDIFEGLDIHIAFAPEFVNLDEFLKLPAKIRGFDIWLITSRTHCLSATQECGGIWARFLPLLS
jgi:hypothetical protein